MALYFKDIEITNINNLVPQTGLDITGLWFGSTNIYTVWQTYEGALPATLNANGDDMRQYQIWGNTGGVGEPTENLYDKNDDSMNFIGYVNNTTYTVVKSSVGSFSIIIPVEPNTTYTVVKPATSRFRVGLFTSYPYLGDVATAICGDRNGNGADYGTSLTFTTSNNTSYILVFIRNYDDPQTTNEQMKNSTMVLKGSTIPEFYIPFGYQLDMSLTSVNLFDYRNYVDGYYISSSGVETEASHDPIYKATWLNRSDYISILPGESYTMSTHHQNMNATQTVAIAWYDENKIFILRDSTLIPKKNAGSYSFTATAPQNARFAIFNFFTDDVQGVMFIPGTTPPDKYQPYSDTTTPIYIGDEPLDKDEYVDYTTQKVYRMINGVLTPTDPPAPLPALPTCNGTTSVSYAGSGTAPEKVFLKYRKENF